MKKTCLSAIVLLLAFITAIRADSGRSITIHQGDSTTQKVPITDIQRIYWENEMMMIDLASGETFSYPISSIVTMTFDNASTAIKMLASDQGSQAYTITDIAGHTLFQGTTEVDGTLPEMPPLKGIYMITIGGESHKVFLNGK